MPPGAGLAAAGLEAASGFLAGAAGVLAATAGFAVTALVLDASFFRFL